MLGGTKLQKRWLSARRTTNSPQKRIHSSARLSCSAQVDLRRPRAKVKRELAKVQARLASELRRQTEKFWPALWAVEPKIQEVVGKPFFGFSITPAVGVCSG
jgi:hypothetical protein